jgi:isopentenyldiphosphate isomerase
MIKVATLWLVNENGELLLARRADHKPQDPGVWGPTVTGKLEPGESFDEALGREVEEELALSRKDYTPHHLLEVEYIHPDGEPRTFSIYYATFASAKTKALRIEPDEVAEIAWFSLNKLANMLVSTKEQFVPSALQVWPPTFAALKRHQVSA